MRGYAVLKQSSKVKNFLNWLKEIFDVKQKPLNYLLVFLLGIIFVLPQCFISGYEQMAPLYSLVLAIPMLLFGGGLEEAGWRHIL